MSSSSPPKIRFQKAANKVITVDRLRNVPPPRGRKRASQRLTIGGNGERLTNPRVTSAISHQRRKLERSVLGYLNNRWVQRLIILVTVTSLVADDVRVATCNRWCDRYFGGLALFEMVVFSLELLMRLIAMPSSRSAQHLILPLLNIASLLSDVGLLNVDLEGWLSLQSARTTLRASSVDRLVWLLRTPRLVLGIARCVSMCGGSTVDKTSASEQSTTEQTTVERRLNEQTTMYLLGVVLLMSVFIPLLDGTILQGVDNTYKRGGLEQLHHFLQDYNVSGSITAGQLMRNVRLYARDAGSLMFMELCVPRDANTHSNGCSSSWTWTDIKGWLAGAPGVDERYTSLEEIKSVFRRSDYVVVSVDTCFVASVASNSHKECHSTAAFSQYKFVGFWSWLNIVKTVLVILIATFTTILFSFDAQRLVVGPIQRMTSMVRRLGDNPLAAIKNRSLDDKQGLETGKLEEVLNKIGKLLQKSFGAAGGDIIGKNMGKGELNPLMPGKKITSIYGFCDIRQFTDTTECLQSEVFTYVNSIAFIVHGCAHAYYGMANKNVGDAFLLSWKLCDGVLGGYSDFTDEPDEETRLQANETVRCSSIGGDREENGSVNSSAITPTEMADCALTAFLKCKVDMDWANVRGSLVQFRNHPALLKRFPGGDFKVRMGFGLHVGWAVEGAIGSQLKIDATYISPHVDMSERLEASTKKYDSPVIMSHWFVGLLSPAAQSYLRPVDCITAKAIPVPVTLYTFDVLFDSESVRPTFNPPLASGQTKGQPAEPPQQVDFATSSLYRELQANLHPAFLTSYRAGFEAYLDGEWNEAQQLLRDALNFKAGDAPILRLLKTMEEYDYIPPEDWDGSVADSEF